MKWYENAVMYHIYPLGFCGAPKHNEGGEPVNRLEKVLDWIPHLKELGVDAVYFGPVFESVEHGYDTTDYRVIDRRLGTNEMFAHICDELHKNGIRVILDGVFNHVGRNFWAFKDVQEKGQASEYCDWFAGLNFGGQSPCGDNFWYEGWNGYYNLVKLNLRNWHVCDYLIDAVKLWMDEFHIDGIRFDAADCVDFDFFRRIHNFCKERNPEFWLMGEIIHGDYKRWANPEMLHSVTNYELHKGLWSGHNDHNYFEIAHTMRRLQGLCHDTRLYLFSDNHDVERLPNKLRNREHIRHIAILVYSLWGIPSIYYGSEFGIEGKKEWGSDWPLRPCLELNDYADAERTNPVTSVYKALGKCKAELPEMTYGEVKELQLTTQCYAFARVLDGKAVVAVLNNGDTPAQLEFQLPVETAKVTDLLADTVGAQEVLVSTEWNRMKVQLPSNYATLLRVE